MHRNDAAKKVADAMNEAKAYEAAKDPEVTSVTIELDGNEATYKFSHKRPSERADELTKWRLALVTELADKPSSHFSTKAPAADPKAKA